MLFCATDSPTVTETPAAPAKDAPIEAAPTRAVIVAASVDDTPSPAIENVSVPPPSA